MIADPICTFLFSILVLFTTVPIMKDCVRLLLEGTNEDVEVDEVIEDIERLRGVEKV